MSRFFAAFALLLLSFGTASAQMLPGNAAPPTHPGTRLNFPPSVAGAQLERDVAILILRAVANYLAARKAQHGHRHVLTTIGEHAGHPNFCSD